MKSADVFVLGGGPAGSTAAIELARRGLEVVVWERHDAPRPRIGESLPPDAARLLTGLGVMDAFLRDGPMESPGVVSAWGGSEPAEHDFLFSPYQRGWHVDRVKFDALLLRCALSSGAIVECGVHVHSARWTPADQWILHGESSCGSRSLRTQFVVDATGRSSFIGRRKGAIRVRSDRLVGLAALVDLHTSPDRRLTLQAVHDGWWYVAPLPAGRRVAVFMTDSDLLDGRQKDHALLWRERIIDAPLAAAHVAPSSGCREVLLLPAESAVLLPVHGPGWAAVGDAALTFDPLSGSGLVKALETGLQAAPAVASMLRGNPQPMLDYDAWVRQAWAAYRQSLAGFYALETRFPGSPFWSRRRPAAAL